jgi:hypothetical protein
MTLIDVLIPLIPGILLVAFPHILTPKTASADGAAKRKSKLRKLGYCCRLISLRCLAGLFASAILPDKPAFQKFNEIYGIPVLPPGS